MSRDVVSIRQAIGPAIVIREPGDNVTMLCDCAGSVHVLHCVTIGIFACSRVVIPEGVYSEGLVPPFPTARDLSI